MNCQKGSTGTFTIYIDQAYTGTVSNGTYISPYKTLATALASVNLSTPEKEKIFHVSPGNYLESIDLSGANRVIIEGSKTPFVLQIPAGAKATVKDSLAVKFRNFNFDSTLITDIGLEIDNTNPFTLENMTMTGAGVLLDADTSTVFIQTSTLSSTVTVTSPVIIKNSESSTIVSSSFSGGTYNLNVRDTAAISITDSTFSGMLSGGIYLQKVNLPVLNAVTVSGLPNSTSNTAGIFITGGTGGRIDNTTITGAGSNNPPCATTFFESGLYITNHSSIFIDNINISAIGCNGVYISGSNNIVVSRYKLSGNGRGVHFRSSRADLFQGTISASVEYGAFLEDSITSIDLSTIDGTTTGPGIFVKNTQGGDNSIYQVNNATTISNNFQQGFVSTGNEISPGIRITIKNSTFQNNNATFPLLYAIEGAAPIAPVDGDDKFVFTCLGNTFISQPNEISPVIAGLASDDNLTGKQCEN